MSGVSAKDLFALQRELKMAVKQAKLLGESSAPMRERLDVLEARSATFWARLRWLVVGR